MRQLTEHIYGILRYGGNLNYYVIVNGDAVTVVDIGLSEKDVDILEKSLTQIGRSLDDVRYVLITHAHPDHVGGMPALQQRTNAHTMIHRLDAPVLRGEQPVSLPKTEDLPFFSRLIAPFVKDSVPAARVDSELNDGDVLDEILPGLRVVHLPGHSYGQVGYWLETERLLIGGDVMMRILGRLRMPLRPASPDWETCKRSIGKVADMDVDKLLLGHGKPIMQKAEVEIRELAEKQGV